MANQGGTGPAIILGILLAVSGTGPESAALLGVPPDHPVYDHLDHFRALGLVHGSLELRPMTRGRLSALALEVLESPQAGKPGRGDRARLEELRTYLDAWGRSEKPPAAESGLHQGRPEESSLPLTCWEIGGGLAFYGAASGPDSLPNLDRRQRREEALFFSMDAAAGRHLFVQTRFYEDYSRLSPQPDDQGWTDNMPLDLEGITKDPSARNHRAVLGVGAEWIQARMGREDRLWGVGRRGTLFLSENPFPMDGISLAFQTRYVSGATLFAQTARGPDRRATPADSVGHDCTPPDCYPPSDGYIAAHRFEFTPPWPVRLGIYEAAAYGGRGIDLGYLNPVALLVAVTQDIYDRSGTDDKKVIGADFSLDLPPVRIYGEFLLNRLVSGDSAPLGRDSEISGFAQLAGLRWANPLGWSGADLDLEYTHLDPEVYFHRDSDPTRAFLHEGELIGHWAGPNADDLYISLQLPPLGRWGGARLAFEQVRWGLLGGLRGAEAGFTGLRKRDKEWITGPVQNERIVTVEWWKRGWDPGLPGQVDTSLLLARVDRTGAWSEDGWVLELRLRWESGRVLHGR